MKIINMNTDWYVYPRDDAFSMVTSIPDDAIRTDVPYDALFHQGQSPDSLNGGRTGYYDSAVWYYQKEWYPSDELKGKQLTLTFEGIFSKSFVYINGSLAGSGDFGYVSVNCDITGYVRFSMKNTILVICKTDPYSSRWYTGTGIQRPVYLYVQDPVHIQKDSIRISTEDIFEEGARIRLQADLISRTGCACNTELKVEIYDESDTILNVSFPVRMKDTFHLDHFFFLKDCHLYSENDPHLYQVKITCDQDDMTLRTGFRLETWDSRRGLCINGRPVKLRGACIHHDTGLLGGISSYAFESFRIHHLKQAGFNAIRCAHNHASQELLRACDEADMYVLDEICDMWTKMKGFSDYAQYFQHSWKEITGTMVKEDRIHPCVIGYSTGNEISDINTEKGFETAYDLFTEIHRLDDTRFVTNGVNGAFAAGEQLADIAADLTGKDRSEFENGDVNQFMALMASRMNDIVTHPVVSNVLQRLEGSVDVQGYNYMTARYREDAADCPQRVMLGTETYPRQIAENWHWIKALPAVIGDFTWTGWDYTGELRMPYPAWNNPAGDLNVCGFRRPVSYYREIVYGLRKKPYICVRPPETYGSPRQFGPWQFTDAVHTWSFDIPEKTMVCVEVYTSASSVQLYLNNRLIDTEEVHDCYALFDVPYEPGTLLAVSADKETAELSTADTRTKHAVINSEEYDGWLFEQIFLQDKDGNPLAGNGEEYLCEKDGYELIAAGSEESDAAHQFKDSLIRIYGPGALAVYRKK